MHNCFRKYFLLFTSFFLLQPVLAMENNKFCWRLGALYAAYTAIKNYLPTFSLPSFIPEITKYNFCRKNIKSEQNMHVNISTNNEESREFEPPPNSYVTPPKSSEKITFIKLNIPKKRPPSQIFLQDLGPNQNAINGIQDLHKLLSDRINANHEPIENQSTKVDIQIDKKFSLAESFLNAVKSFNFDQERNFEVIEKFIIEKGPNCPIDQFKRTPLMATIKYQEKKIFHFLLEKGADIDVCDVYGQTALHKYVWHQSFCNDITIDDLLLDSENDEKLKADRNILDKYGQTPLFLAISQQCNSAVIERLITKKNINIQNINGITPLRCALYKIHNKETLNVLYKSGVSLINIDKQNNSIFHHLIYLDKQQLEGLIASIIKYTYHSYILEEGFVKIEKLEESLRNSTIEKQFSGITINEKQLIANLFNQNSKDIPVLYSVMHHMIRIQEALQHPNIQKQTPWQLLHKLCGKTRLKNIKNLFDENRPKNDFIIFLKTFPNQISVPAPNQKESKSNWAEIAYHYYISAIS